MAANYTGRALSRSTGLVRAYTDSVDGDLTADVDALLDQIADEEELCDVLASLAGLAGHAVMVIAARLEADLAPEDDPDARQARVLQERANVLDECTRALREFRPAVLNLPPGGETGDRERRSGFDRRVGSNRRHLAPGSPPEKINLRLFGERRMGVSDRRRGGDRRSAGDTSG